MLQSFIIVLREGFESFLLVAVILSYLRKSGQRHLAPAVYWAIALALLISGGLGYLLFQMQTGNDAVFEQYLGTHVGGSLGRFMAKESLREGVLGLVAIVMVASLVVYMWRMGPRLKERMEARLGASVHRSGWTAFLGVFLFTVLTISREGIETALMLLQVRNSSLVWGLLLGLFAAGGLAWAWAAFGHLINVRRFFQVTGVFLLLFMVQVGIFSFHEFAEAGVLPNSEALHTATETLSPEGLYGKWFPLIMVGICAAWLLGAWIIDRFRQPPTPSLTSLQGSR